MVLMQKCRQIRTISYLKNYCGAMIHKLYG
nr:MAG TPA: hypothetical protein [Bacteriophage sp.]